MALKFPTPPTPPTPPAIDKGDGTNSNAKIDAPNFFQVPFVRDYEEENYSEEPEEVEEIQEPEEVQQSEPIKRQVTTPETMARDAVANGAGALTKRTVTRPEEQEQQQPTPKIIQIPSTNDNLSLSDAERGKAVLREFQEEDRQISESKTDKVRTSSETQSTFKNNFTQTEGYGGLFWLITLILTGIISFVIVKKYLLKDKPKLKTTDLFADSTQKLKSATKKITSAKTTPIVKPARLPKKEDDDKGKHFEVRV